MNEKPLLDKVRQHRSLLLACETIGWLHMIGKAKVKFLQNPETGFDKQWYAEEKIQLDWLEHHFNNAYQEWKFDGNPPAFNNLIKLMFEDFAEHKSKQNLVGLLQAGHGMASGIEKNIPKETPKYLNQTQDNMWLSSAFGKPEKNLLGRSPELTDETWKELMKEVKKILTKLQECAGKGKNANWGQWRDESIGCLREKFTQTLAETRIPNNDVTLWDQSYVAAALFKSAVAGAIIEGKSFKWSNGNIKQEIQWRLLTVGMGAEHYESRAVKIRDLIGARQQIDDFFKKVCSFVEVDLAIGSLLYRDSEVLVFSFPSERRGETKDVLRIKDGEEAITQEIDRFASEAKFETPPYCAISEKSSRSLVCMTKEIQTAREVMAVPIHRAWEIADGTKTGGHVCPVCLVRRNGEGSKKSTLCEICKGRKENRLKNWLTQKDKNTIWINEVADSNDRVALVTMSLDIEPWLDGSRLDSLRAQAISEWQSNNEQLNKQDNPNKPFENLLAHIKSKLGTFDISDSVLRSLQEGYKHEKQINDTRSDEEIWKAYFSKIVEDRTDGKAWKDLDDDARAKWLTHQFFRKLASPGRVYRFQCQAKEFFETLLANFKCQNDKLWRTRLVLKPDNSTAQGWEDGQVYNSNYGDAPLDLLYREKSNDFLTISNLARGLKSGQNKDEFIGKALKLKSEDDEGDKYSKDLVVQSVMGVLETYCPIIPLEISPVRFRVFVPLEDVSEFVDEAIKKWQEEFSRVWDKLPLRVGVVAFKRKTPFQSVIEMARTVEEKLQVKKEKEWKVEKCESSPDDTKLTLTRQDNLQEEQTVPFKFKDDKEDVFYPYFAVKAAQCCSQLDFQHPDGQVYRHVKDLVQGDMISVYPSQIVTVFMDDSSARFEPIREHGLMDWERIQNNWKIIKKNVLSQTALRGAWAEIAERRTAWQNTDDKLMEGDKEAWLDFVRTVFFTRLKMKDSVLNELVQAAKDDLLEWILEWHITVLKEKITEDKS
ncbi:MAG: CRISPR-associated protein Csx11 [Candidatus Omnitrophica bacterium]|nr:CRISPR-associated protein Csx11 [Candidatus Omnitrophota bacterium]